MVRELAVTLRPHAERDLRRLDRGDRKRVADALRLLAAGAENLDMKALRGAAPWLRLKVGEYRALYRDAGNGLLVVARIVQRGDLIRAVQTLDRKPT